MIRNNGITRRFGPALSTLLIVVVAYVCLFVLICTAIAPMRYDLTAGSIAPITITATKDVEDVLATEQLIKVAERGVEPSYISDSTVIDEVMMQIRDAFRHLITVNGLNKAADGTTIEITNNLLWQAANAISPLSMDESLLTAVMEVDRGTLGSLTNTTTALVLGVEREPFWQGQETTVIGKISDQLTQDGFSEELVEAAMSIVHEYLRPNMILDEDTIERNRQKARDEVEPVIYKRGQNIVRSGEVVTTSQLAMLDSLGMLKDRGMDWSMYFGIGITLVLMIGMIVLYLYAFEPKLLQDPRHIALLAVIVILVVAVSLIARTINTFMMPVTLGAMLTVLLLKPRLALTTSVVLSIITGMMASASAGVFSTAMFSIMLNSIFSSALCVAIIRSRQQRGSILIAGLIVAAANMITTVAAGLINSANLRSVFINALWSAGSGIFSAVLCIGLQPILEWIFNIDTSAKLLELSNPNQPLLRRLLLEAPGTYHHSILVANLAEAGASAIGANGLLARVGAYYHDIGKLKRPIYFKENQLNDNPHDRTDPRVSAAILTAHPTDGVQMAQKGRLPIPVQEIILQHHGDAPTLFFYDKAMKQGFVPDISEFRYSGPRPCTRESAIVMMADTVEASARTLRESSPEKIQQLIQKLVRAKMEDGQLDECPLTFSDLKKICDAFLTVLTGVYHQRIEYPNIEIPERKNLPEDMSVKQNAQKAVEKPRDTASEQAGSTQKKTVAQGTDAGNAAPLEREV